MKLLVVGDLSSGLEAASKIALERGARVLHSNSLEDALENLRSGQGINLIFIEIKQDVALFIKFLKAEQITIPVIACGYNNDSIAAVKSIKAGARDYITLPPDANLIAKFLEIVSNNQKPLIFSSPEMSEIISIADKISKSEANILITGPSGTGKEVLSHYIHNNSNRTKNNFIKINCAAIPESLLESELFGHEKGAFTGAVARKLGKFEEANNGTLLLDEISEMDKKLQAKLLRAIQEGEFTRLGGSENVKVNIRIIATSNRNLQEEIKNGNFREDLFFRLNTIELELPPLNKRKSDIAELTKFFLDKYCSLNKISPKKLSDAASKALIDHDWPGNIRELENTIHRAVLLSSNDTIMPENLKLNAKNHFIKKTLRNAEHELIQNTLHYCLGDFNTAAEILGISIANLNRKLEEFEAK